MGWTCVAYACALLLLCPLTATQYDDIRSGHLEFRAHSKLPLVLELKHDMVNRLSPTFRWRPIGALSKHKSRLKRQVAEEGTVDDYTYDDDDEDDGDEGDDYSGEDESSSGGKKEKKPVDKMVKPFQRATSKSGWPPVTDVPMTTSTLQPVTTASPKNVTPRSFGKGAIMSKKSPTTAQTKMVTLETSYSNTTESSIPQPSTKTLPSIDETLEKPTNKQPKCRHRMKKLVITAGKAFRYSIPEELIADEDDGTNLTFTLYDEDRNLPVKDSWIQFTSKDREVYGLPLEAHVSHWHFIVEAKDSGGLYTECPLDISVEPHKGLINHKFILEFKLNQSFTNAIDWQIRALGGIVNVIRGTDMEQLTVLDAKQKGRMCEFIWSNDTLLKNQLCPKDEILEIMKIMLNDTGAPSTKLTRAMSPDLVIGGVRWDAAGPCLMLFAPQNQVDLLTATTGRLFVHRVPDDMFYDVEDGSTRNLVLSLRYSDRSELPPTHWLQFDSKNQEFFGLPGPADVGSVNYLLIAQDSNNKSTHDNLLVEVEKAPPLKPSAEFRISLKCPFSYLANSAKNKRRVVEKLAALFGQTDTSNIHVDSITDSPTTVIWYNMSLPTDTCPKREIQELREIVNEDESDDLTGLTEIVNQVFDDKDLKVLSFTIEPLGVCLEDITVPDDLMPPVFAEMSMDPKLGKEEPLIWRHNTGYDDATNQDHMITLVLPAIVFLTIFVLGVLLVSVFQKRRAQIQSGEDFPCVRIF